MSGASFTDLIIDYTKSTESPESYWRWSSYATIAAALRHNVYYERVERKIYPNLYVLLLGDSAARKGPPVDLATSLLKEIKATKVIEGKNSIQWVIERLANDVGALRGGAGILLAGELASFFVDDRSVIPTLTDIYDFKDSFPYGLRGNAGAIEVKNLCLTLLGASNEEFLQEVYDNRAIYGGLMRRTFFIRPNEQRPGCSFFDLPPSNASSRKQITEKLVKISALKGQFTATPKAQEIYNHWYYNIIYPQYTKRKDPTGVLGGMHTLVFKLAMIVAAGRESLVINEEDVTIAIDQVVSITGNYAKYAMSTAVVYNSNKAASVIFTAMYGQPNYTMSEKEILRNHWSEMGTTEEFNGLITKLLNAQMLERTQTKEGIGYKLTALCVRKLEGK